MVDWQQETADPNEFMESLKVDLEQDEVFVFTPKGKVITLPTGATGVDFAYAIHTEVGHRCIGARVNGRLVALESILNNGDTVEIFTSKAVDAAPSRWSASWSGPRAGSTARKRTWPRPRCRPGRPSRRPPATPAWSWRAPRT